MQTIDHQVFTAVGDWLARGDEVWLCTIVRTVGSAPRPLGSLLACNDNGEQVGSLSGGCIEEDLLQRLRAGDLATGSPLLIEYGVSAQENERLGLPCGGRLEVLVEYLPATPGVVSQLQTLLATLDERRCICRFVDLDTGVSRLEPVDAFVPLALSEQELRLCFGPRMRMLLIGAGQLAQSVSELALAMDYEVMVTDPRTEVLAQWAGPELTLLSGMPDDRVREFAADSHSIVITLTHDPRIDDMALMEALATQAWYVGALGSVRTTAKRLLRLRELELTDAQLDRLHAPVGLSIGSKTPVEIAVAIMAQITQLRRQR